MIRDWANRYRNHPVSDRHRAHHARMAQFPSHPARLAALAANELRWRGPACPNHPKSPRWTSSGQCEACNRERSLRQSQRRTRRIPIYLHPALLAAREAGAKHWAGPPCRHGHDGVRYVAGGFACVRCVNKRTAHVG